YLREYLAAVPNAPDAVSVRTEIEAREKALRDRADTERAEAEAKAAKQRADEEAARARQAAEAMARAQEETGRARHPRWPGYLLLGGGVVFLGAGIALGVNAQNTAKVVEQGTGRFDPTLQTRGKSTNLAAISLDVVGGVILAGGAGLLLWAY